MITESDSMVQNLVIYVQGGQVRRAMADFDDGINCLIVYADVPTADQGQPWVREIEWPARDRQEVLLEGIAVERSPDEVGAVVRAYAASRVRVRELLRDADSPAPGGADHDEDTLRMQVYRLRRHDSPANGTAPQHVSQRLKSLPDSIGACRPRKRKQRLMPGS